MCLLLLDTKTDTLQQPSAGQSICGAQVWPAADLACPRRAAEQAAIRCHAARRRCSRLCLGYRLLRCSRLNQASCAGSAPRRRAAYGSWAATALLFALSVVVLSDQPILTRLGIHKGLRRGTIGYVRLLKVGVVSSTACARMAAQCNRLALQDAGPLLPPVLHATIRPEDMLPGRVIVVGDAHGCVDELKALMRKVDYVQGNDTLILAGDLVDKGPDSIGVRSLTHMYTDAYTHACMHSRPKL